MTTPTLEERVATLEAEVARMKEEKPVEPNTPQVAWWEAIRGTFKDDPVYDEAMAMGLAYRESLRPASDSEVEN